MNDGLTINQICQHLQVSTATVRNWIKVGELTVNAVGNIDKKSFENFEKNIIGKTKLNKRANKLSKIENNTNELKQKLLQDLENGEIDPEKASELYEKLLTDVEKNKQGIYYTPNHIIQDMLKNIDICDKKIFLDPCCGSGNFIIEMIKKGFNPSNIFAFDIDPIAIKIAQKRFEKMTGLYAKSQIQCMDFLEYSQQNPLKKYDYIYTNPPWGQKINRNEKNKLAERFDIVSENVNDTCSLFLMIALKHLQPLGSLGFLMPDAVFNIGVYEPIRELLLQKNIKRLVDYGKVFQGLQTGAGLIEIDNQYVNNDIICQTNFDNFLRTKQSFFDNPKKIFNIHCSRSDANIIQYLYEKQHILLDRHIEWGLGIVTGNNAKHISPIMQNDYVAVYKGSDILVNDIKQPTNFIHQDFSKYQQVAPLRMYQAPEKLIYRFISSKLIFYYDNQQRYVLNSANILLATDDFSYSLKLLANILNSQLMNWLFKKIFNTHKILQSDLMCLPIHFSLFDDENFNEDDYLNRLNIERLTNGTYRIKEKID